MEHMGEKVVLLLAGLWPLPRSQLADAGRTFLPFFRAGGAMLARSTLLLGTKTLATAVSTRSGAPENLTALRSWLGLCRDVAKGCARRPPPPACRLVSAWRATV